MNSARNQDQKDKNTPQSSLKKLADRIQERKQQLINQERQQSDLRNNNNNNTTLEYFKYHDQHDLLFNSFKNQKNEKLISQIILSGKESSLQSKDHQNTNDKKSQNNGSDCQMPSELSFDKDNTNKHAQTEKAKERKQYSLNIFRRSQSI